jgi:hypothetical protein
MVEISEGVKRIEHARPRMHFLHGAFTAERVRLSKQSNLKCQNYLRGPGIWTAPSALCR